MSTPPPDFEPGDLHDRITAADGQWRHLADRIAALADPSLYVEELVRLGEDSSTPEARYRAKKLLDRLGGSVPVRAPGESSDSGHILAPPPSGGLAGALAGGAIEQRLAVLKAFVEAHGRPGLQEVLGILADDADVRLVAAALAAVGFHGDASFLPRVEPYLRHRSDRVVATAVETMGRLDAEAAFFTLIPILLRDDNRVRANVLLALYRQQPWVVMANLRRMTEHRDESYRASAIWCLSQVRHESTPELLVSMMRREEAPDLLQKQAELLAEVDRVGAMAELKSLSAGGGEKGAVAVAELSKLEAREAANPRKSGLIRRPTGKLTAVVSLPPEPPWWRTPRALLGMVAIAGIASVALVAWRSSDPDLASPGGAGFAVAARGPAGANKQLPGPRGASAAPAAARVAGGKPVTVQGKVMVTQGPVMVLRSEGTLYGFHRVDGSPWPVEPPGKKVKIRGVKREWNYLHGYYAMDVKVE